MQIINRFFRWWEKTFRKQGVFGKVIFVCSSLFIICCLCSVPIGILYPDTHATATPKVTSTLLAAQIEKATGTLFQTSINVSTATLSLTSSIIIPEPTSSIVPSLTATEILSTPQPPKNMVSVHFIDIGQGDAILIRSPEGLYGLIDGGEAGSGVVQYLQAQGVQKLDLVVATHPHADHIGGLVAVLQIFPTTRVVTNGETHTTAIYEYFLDAIAASKAEYIEVVRGNILKLGSLTLTVLNPGPIVEGDLNRNSLVLRMTYNNTTILFMGDANNDTEAEMISANLPLKADILKVGHHGSYDSTSMAFLVAVHPIDAVYSAGKGNSYGYPGSDTLARLGDAGANILGTDTDGSIVFLVDAAGYSIQTAKQFLTQTPTVTPTINLTAISTTQTVSPEDISISVVSLTSPISPGGMAQLIINTAPGADCSITVYYKSGPSQAAGLGSQIADASGRAIWMWKVGSSTTKGIWNIVVQSTLGVKTATLSIPFEVR